MTGERERFKFFCTSYMTYIRHILIMYTYMYTFIYVYTCMEMTGENSATIFLWHFCTSCTRTYIRHVCSMYTYMYVCIHTCMCVYVHGDDLCEKEREKVYFLYVYHIYVHIYVTYLSCIHTCIRAWRCRARKSVYTKNKYTCIYTCIHRYMYTYMYTCIHI